MAFPTRKHQQRCPPPWARHLGPPPLCLHCPPHQPGCVWCGPDEGTGGEIGCWVEEYQIGACVFHSQWPNWYVGVGGGRGGGYGGLVCG